MPPQPVAVLSARTVRYTSAASEPNCQLRSPQVAEVSVRWFAESPRTAVANTAGRACTVRLFLRAKPLADDGNLVA
jgi:hypothetical protein